MSCTLSCSQPLSRAASPCLHRQNLIRMLFPVILALSLPRGCRAQSPRQRVRRQAKRRRGRRRQAGQSLLLLCLVGPRTTASERWPSTLRTQALRQRPAQCELVRAACAAVWFRFNLVPAQLAEYANTELATQALCQRAAQRCGLEGACAAAAQQCALAQSLRSWRGMLRPHALRH